MSIEGNRIARSKRSRQWDFGTIAGAAIVVAAVAGGLIPERGHIGDLGSIQAGLLVLGGTIGAVVIGTPFPILAGSLRRCRSLFRRETDFRREAADQIIRCAVLARRLSLAAVEPEAEAVKNGLLRRALLLVVDGVPAQEIRRQLQIDIAAEEDRAEADARVFEQAGGYAPTIGIIGAVIGLIQVMRQLGNVEEVGRGIATAFTSTLYGVALANLVLLPLAARIRSRTRSEIGVKELILEGVTALSEGLSPRLIRTRLEILLEWGEAATSRLPVPALAPEKATRKTA
jgi:chemotaxis protein MotA